jgi:hypothetical protein
MRNRANMLTPHRLLGWILLLPFLALTLIPAQIMPARAADGTLTMVLCIDGSEAEVTIDLATGQPVEHAPLSADNRCDWASAYVVVAHLAQPVLTPLVQQPQQTGAPILTTMLAATRTTGLPPSTGPPFLL